MMRAIRRRMASWLRWCAERLDPAPVVPSASPSSHFRVAQGAMIYYDGTDGTLATDTFLACKHAGYVGTRFLHDGVQRDEVRA